MIARLVTYNHTGDARDLARRAEAGILPILQAEPGFKAYSVAAGDGQILSLSVWESRAEAQAGNEAVAAWVADNMASELDVTEVRFAEMMFSTTLGVTTAAAATV